MNSYFRIRTEEKTDEFKHRYLPWYFGLLYELHIVLFFIRHFYMKLNVHTYMYKVLFAFIFVIN